MKIYIYSYATTEMGGGTSTATTVKYLKKRGHDVYVFTNYRAFRRKIVVDKPDLVLHHNILGIRKVSKLCGRYNVPVIATINNLVSDVNGLHVILDEGFGKPYLRCKFLKSWIIAIKQKRIHTFFHKLYSIVFYPYRFYRRNERIRVLNEIEGVIAISSTLAKLMQLNGVNRKIHVCPQPIDDTFLNPSKKIKYYKKTILFIGGGEPFKGVHVLIEAFKKLDMANTQLLIVGEVRKAHKIDFSSYPDNIKFLGILPIEKVKQLYYSADFLAFPSLWFDAFGRGWAEALCCGCPVLSLKDRGGAADYLEHKKTGYLVDSTMEGLTEGLRTLLEDKQLRKKLSKNGRRYAKKYLIASQVIRRLEKIYDEVLHAKPTKKAYRY